MANPMFELDDKYGLNADGQAVTIASAEAVTFLGNKGKLIPFSLAVVVGLASPDEHAQAAADESPQVVHRTLNRFLGLSASKDGAGVATPDTTVDGSKYES